MSNIKHVTRLSVTLGCPHCGATYTVDRDEDGPYTLPPALTYRCQGATPDLCEHRACRHCRTDCTLCGLPVCEEHAQLADGGLVCDNCRATFGAGGKRGPMKIDRLSTLAQHGLRSWAISVHHDEMLLDAISSLPEHWAWVWFQLREAEDKPEWFPRGKWATLQEIERHLILEARCMVGTHATTERGFE